MDINKDVHTRLQAGAQSPIAPFRVLTLNVHKGFTPLNRKYILPELRDAVHQVSADIVFLQEVLGSHERHKQRHANWAERPQYEFLADTIWKDFAYGRNAVYPHGHHGNAVLSKYPILHYENRDVSLSAHERRGLLHCVLEVPGTGQNIHAFCVHLGLQEAHRQHQINQLAHMIDADVPSGAPLIVAGDFNDWRTRGHLLIKERLHMREVFAHNNNGHLARTFPVRMPTLRLDRIYVRNLCPDRTQVLSRRPWSHLSDHAALLAELRPEKIQIATPEAVAA